MPALEIVPFEKTVNILGTAYTIEYRTEAEDPKLVDKNAYIEPYSKEIIVDKEAISSHGIDGVRNEKLCFNQIIRHEILHGFFHEAGLRDYCEDEMLVDALAILFPKIVTAIQDVDAGH